eukprot:TRINITY_DN36_c0_g2_i3.p1 TRINITY_DN36_c0_g2~~TRINITY_DN36_c0_g2_i3.p1  ORF type:complete len:424 (+),score=55.70 TRINITY_DN36_c0_g2_i3:1430-2701(+)
MSTLPKLYKRGHPLTEAQDNPISPVTPATAEGQATAKENGFGNKRRRIGGLPISALVNEEDDDTPVPYPLEHQAPAIAASAAVAPAVVAPAVVAPAIAAPAIAAPAITATATTEPMTPVQPKFPSILYQMSEFVTQLEEQKLEGSLPSLKSLGLPKPKLMPAPDVTKKLSDGPDSQLKPSNVKPDEVSGRDKITASDKANESSGKKKHEKELKTPRQKRTRTERDAPITTEPEIESLINTLREREQSRTEEANKSGAPECSEPKAPEERKIQTEALRTPSANNSSPGVSNSARVTKPKKQRRGRPNGDNRPRPHACPTCHRRFHQQSGVVNHYRVVHLKEKRFECPHKCGLRFGARGDVTRHVDAVHNKLRNFECQVCGDAFARKSILTRHCKNMHNDVFGAGEAHDCVHGCVIKPKNVQNEE